MRILLLADAYSPHTIRWASGLSQKGFEVSLFTLSQYDSKVLKEDNSVKVFSAQIEKKFANKKAGSFSKVIYLTSLLTLKSVIKKIQPQVVHAHFASSYGLLGALSGFSPFFLSVWGSDVFEFPNKGLIQKLILKYVFFKAQKIFSTSNIMAVEISKYTSKSVAVIPFGIDTHKFRKFSVDSIFSPDDLVIGIIKSLEPKYGIFDLIEAFNLLKDRGFKNIKLLIAGDGSQREELQTLVINLGLEKDVVFAGKVSVDEVPRYHNMMDIEVYPSYAESFGVSILEASACEIPVIVSRVGGLIEIVEDNKTGLFIEAGDVENIFQALEKMIRIDGLRILLGNAGRNRVNSYYKWEQNLSQMTEVYYSSR